MKREETLSGAAGRLVSLLIRRGGTFAAAESCTGGLIASAAVGVPGASRCFAGGAVSYSDESKTILAGVPADTVGRFTAVSPETAAAMAKGIREKLGADYGVATTGFAGPGGGTERDPVGAVYLAVSSREGETVVRRLYPGGRRAIRLAAARDAVLLLCETVKKEENTTIGADRRPIRR